LLYQQKQENIRQANENINQARVNSEYRVRTRALMADVTRDLRGPAKSLLVAMSAIGDSQPELPEMKRTAYRALAQLRERRILDHQTAVQSVQFAPDNPTILLTTTRDGNLRFWDTDTGRLKGNYHFIGGRFLTARWHPTGEGLFVSSRGIGSFFLLPCGSEELRPLFPGCTAKTVDEQTPFNEETGTGIFSPDGKWLVTGGFGLPTKLWDVTEIDKPIRNFGNTASFNVSAAFSPDSNRLALGTSTGELRIFEVAQARKPRELTPDVLKDTGSRPDGFQEIGAGITSVAFHPKDPNIVMATSQDGTIRIWDIEKRHPRRLHAEAAGGMVFQGVFNPAGTWIATAHEDRVIRLWPLAAAAPREQTLRGHDKIAFSISYNSDGSAIASGASDNTARIWSQRSTLARAPMIPSSTDLALGSVPITLRRDHLIFSYNGAEISAEVPSDFGTPAVAAIAPSGKDIVVAPKQGRPHLYDRASGTDFLTLPGRVEKWSQVGFYQDSTSDSGPIHIFGVTEDGRRYGWAYFQDLQELKRFAESKIPFVGIGVNERLSLEPDQLCRIEARPESECAPKDDSAPE
jgi:WD40 repeat protein